MASTQTLGLRVGPVGFGNLGVSGRMTLVRKY